MDQVTQHQVLTQLVSQGRLSKSEAKEIEGAPKVWIPAREILSYLGALIVLIGIVRLFIVVFKDASVVSIVVALYVGSAGLAVLAFRTQSGEGFWHRFGEVMEIAALGTCATATGLWINETNISEGWPPFIAAAVVLPWSIFRLRSSEFASVLTFPASLITCAASFGVIIGLRDENTSLPVLLAALLIVLVGAQDISSPRFVRAIGGLVFLMSAPNWTASRDGLDGLIPVLAIGGLLFLLGATRMWLELLPTSALVIVISVVSFVIRNIDNEVAQAVVILATGLVVIVASIGVMKDFRFKKPHGFSGEKTVYE